MIGLSDYYFEARVTAGDDDYIGVQARISGDKRVSERGGLVGAALR